MTDDDPPRNTTIPAPACASTIPPGDWARIARAGRALSGILDAIQYGQDTRNELLVDTLRHAEALIRGELGA